MNKLILLTFCALLVASFVASEEECGPCVKEECVEDRMLCVWGHTLDICGCCKRCARGIGQMCGEGELSCGDGLECQLNEDTVGECIRSEEA